MNLNFAAALLTLGAEAAFRIANGSRPPASYLLNDILPERNVNSYHVESGGMTVRATMAGLVAMDSDYPPTGHISVDTFLETTAKIANHTKLPEATLRTLQQAMATLTANGQGVDTTATVVQEALNFFNLVIMQPQLDVSEWLRGQLLSFGALNWQFNKKGLVVDYGVPSANIFPLRTLAGNTAYSGSGSLFWTDVRNIRRALKRTGTRIILAHPDTVEDAQYNTVNSMVVTAETDATITFRKLVSPSSAEFTADANDTVTIVKYGAEGEILNPADPTTTIVVPFIEPGKLIGIGNAGQRGYRPGMGSQDNPADLPNTLGYTHIGPTVEGGGRAGRWGDMFTPQYEPWSLHGRAASNQLPVLESPDMLAIATTELAP
jgi:hypothetical protein